MVVNPQTSALESPYFDTDGEKMEVFESGAKRSGKQLRYDLIPTEPLRRLAERYTLGAKKYGDHNWRRGLRDKEFVQQLLNHLIAHVEKFKDDGNDNDDNLAAIAWGAFALMEAEMHSLDVVESLSHRYVMSNLDKDEVVLGQRCAR